MALSSIDPSIGDGAANFQKLRFTAENPFSSSTQSVRDGYRRAWNATVIEGAGEPVAAQEGGAQGVNR